MDNNGTPPPSLRDRLLESPRSPAGELTLPELGGVRVYLRRWSLADRLRVEALTQQKDRPAAERQADLLRLCLADADNRPLFANDDPAVMELPGDVADRLVDAAIEANGAGRRAVDRGKGSSTGGTGPPSASSADSPSPAASAPGQS